MVAPQPKPCECTPATLLDWCDFVPKAGAGLVVTQFHASPPSALPVAPAGNASSSQTKSLVVLVDGGGVVVGGGVFVPVVALLTLTVTTVALAMLPAASRATALSVCEPLVTALV